MTTMNEKESRDWDNGNYDGAYEGVVAEGENGAGPSEAYLAGFYSSFELSEIGDEEHRLVVEEWRASHKEN